MNMYRIHIKYVLLIMLCSLFISSCSSNKNLSTKTTYIDLFTKVIKQLKNNDYKKAIKSLHTLNILYPVNSHSEFINLNIIFVYYKLNEFQLAMDYIDQFIRLNPTNTNIDYVLYMRGITAEALNKNKSQKLFFIDYYDRDIQYINIALRDFNQLVKFFPQSNYVNNAIKHLFFLKEYLAKHELSIIKFYNQRGAYVAVINRVKQMLKKYPNTQSKNEALKYMEIAYYKLGLIIEMDFVKNKITLNSNLM